MYDSVEEYFKSEHPHLVGMLNNPGGFWPKVKTNTASNADLARDANYLQSIGRFDSAVYQASTALIHGRLLGKIPNPG